MKKISIIMGISLICGLVFINSINLKSDDIASLDLSLVIMEAQAGTEGCITRPGFNIGSCAPNVSGYWNCVASTSTQDCISD